MRSLIVASLTLFVASILSTNNLSAAETLEADLEKCKIGFVGSKPDGTKHEGGFKKFEIDAKADFDDPTQSSLRIEIKTDSIWSDADKLTAHLKNPDFFDIRKYPKIVFESTEIVPKEENKATITGKLVMLDKTEDLEVPVDVEASDDGIKLVAKFKLDRTKWGMDYGKGKIDDKVEITAELVFKR